ncbi:1,4-alpha-glucan branching protein GlgB [Homoserinimonas hongtaonis]|uniref:1,4-alpha-glucan branching protein GlgB n=1 Tax=Homoserinimonas hongtaonis TaxID=2079791 RepID=UPI000D349FCC|nr:1,4-alpha-glucan branching protein GlgB [Salinibacterium hongtaonis]AWB89590.1 1,4-alpha-glucan branching enzyme [Salinibacterium hongtaonis]
MTIPELDTDTILAIAEARHPHPHSVLGQHAGGDGVIIRVLRPLAETVTAVLSDGVEVELRHLTNGLWHGSHAGMAQPYRIVATYGEAEPWEAEDPYRFSPTVGEMDTYLFAEGRHEELWRMLGAHVRTHEGVAGIAVSVWAPHARAVRVIGDFNGWSGLGHALRRLDDNGVWEIFVPGVGAGVAYKFEILTRAGTWVVRADPMARYTEIPPRTASVTGTSDYEWQDAAWLAQRSASDPHNIPMSVYELHLGSWRPGLSYRDAADQIIDYVTDLGFTHVEFMPLAEHPYGPSWGYQVTGYYAPTSRFGHPDDLRYLIDRLHQAGIGVLMDWVPGHFPKDEWALANFDGQPVYEHPDPRRGEQPDWGTLVFDFGHSQVRNFLVANALYWLEEFHIDGLRVDAVASMLYLDYSREEWLPNEFGGRENLEAISFLQEVNATAYKRYPGIVMIAEESTAFPGVTRPTGANGLGFGLKWNMGWMHDSLQYMAVDPMWRSHHHNDITFSFQYAFSESFMLPISHDEVVHGKGSLLNKMPGDQWQKFANVRAYLAFMWAHPGKQLLFMGQEFGQSAEWSEQRGLDWWLLEQPDHQNLLRFVAGLNRVYRDRPELWSRDNERRGFEWLVGDDAASSVVGFIRWSAEGDPLVAIVNFSGVPLNQYRIGLPFAGEWSELVNSDAVEFGGSGVGNWGAVTAEQASWHGQPASVELTLPPLGALFLAPLPRASTEGS